MKPIQCPACGILHDPTETHTDCRACGQTLPKTCSCPCGEVLRVPRLENGEYEVCNIKCPKCKRRSDGGNFKTGEVLGWITQADADASQAEYERQMFEADNNDFYGEGMGNHYDFDHYRED